ncbi:YfhO family protein [Cytobacillus firmus]|uniref:Multidrug resistance protein B n=1 Tax=Cytobacillus firmus DS1 TaxID=1307436 RepID=W7L341_CYTFI|nr:YfhO family protein [Cytobacillus firmus]EWG10036.1 multidrug resistance protein B [Cytobacillus firmus DS1]
MVHTIKKHILALLIMIGAVFIIHIYFLLSGSYYSPHKSDAGKQFVFFRYFLHQLFSDGEFFWSWKYGLGGDIWGQFAYYYASSVFFWISMLFDIQNIKDVLSLNLAFSFIKTFLAMAFVYGLLQYKQRSRTGSILAGLLYGGVIFFSVYSLRVDYMAEAFIWLPLVILGYEIYLKKQNPICFILGVFLIVITNFYFAFITSIYINLYCVFVYLRNHRQYRFKTFIRHYSKMVFYYGIGFGMAGISFLPSVYAFLHADRFFQDYQIPLLFDLKTYKSFFFTLFFPGEFPITELFNYTLAMPLLVFVLLAAGMTLHRWESRIYAAFSGFFLLLYFLPYSYSFFNGLSAMQPRWLYLFVFTVSLAIAFIYDDLRLETKNMKRTGIIVGSGITIFGSVILKNELTGNPARMVDVWIMLLGMVGVLLLLISRKVPQRFTSAGLVAVMLCHIGTANYHFFTEHLGPYSEQAAKHEMNFTNSGYDNEDEKEIAAYLKKRDAGLYRVTWMNQLESNTPMLYGFNGFSTYQSLVSANIHQFMKERFNILQPVDSPSIFHNLDERQYLETALSNKFYIIPEANGYRPFGYQLVQTMNGFNIYENEYFLPFGYLLEYGINQSKFENLSPPEKDQLLFSAAVAEDLEKMNLLPMDEEKLDTKLVHQGFEGVELHDIKREGSTFRASGEKAYLNLKIDKPEEPGELLVELKVKSLENKQFTAKVNGKQFVKRSPKDKYAYPKETFLVKINPHLIKENIHIFLSEGRYEIDQLKVYFNSYKNYESLAEERVNQSFQVEEYSESSVKGQIQAERDSMLFFPIPYSEGWTIEVDGKQVPFHEVTYSFIGVPVEKGSHEVVLAYKTPYFNLGLSVSVISLAVFLTVIILHRRRKTAGS